MKPTLTKILATVVVLDSFSGGAYLANTAGRHNSYSVGNDEGYESGFREGVKTEGEAPYRLPVADPLPELELDVGASLDELVATEAPDPSPTGQGSTFGSAIDQTHLAIPVQLSPEPRLEA
ncbi:MAG: hypothetical protein KDD47_19490 [Acidobacteria bacterium]|nr:hypothetical protein [Acidobacteriota bacterium]